MKDSKIKENKSSRYILTLLLLPLGVFKCWADDDFDPFMPDTPDPGNAEIVGLLPFVFIVGVFYAFRKFSKRNLNIEPLFQKEDLNRKIK